MSLGKADWAAIRNAWQAGVEPVGRIAERHGTTHQKISARARCEAWARAALATEGCAAVGAGDAAGCDGAAAVAAAAGSTGTADPEVAAVAVVADHDQAQQRCGVVAVCAAQEHQSVRTEYAGAKPGARSDAAASAKRDRRKARRAIVERLFDAMDTKLSTLEARIAAGGDATPADSERTTRALNTLVRSLEKLADYEGKISKAKRRKDGERRAAPADAELRRQELARRIERLLERR